ncbi:NTP-binding protein, partial [Limosilactobacillus reuteri]
MREVKAARTKYLPENITNKRVLDLLLTCEGMFSNEVLKKYKENKKKESK